MTHLLVQKYPDMGVKIWIGIGLLAFVGLLTLSLLMQGIFQAESKRFLACSVGQETQCAPSVIWTLNEWKLPGTSATSLGTSGLQVDIQK